MDPATGFGPLLRFHAHSGVRLALRAMVALVLPVVAYVGWSPDPAETIMILARSVCAAEDRPSVSAAVAALALGMAFWAAPRLIEGSAGWMRHLPVGEPARRRAAAAGLVLAQAPLLAALCLLAAAVWSAGTALSGAKLAGLLLLAPGAASAALPVRRRLLAAPAGIAAVLASLSGAWAGVAAAAILVAAADRGGGPLWRPRPRGAPRSGMGLPFGARILWRATATRLSGGILMALIALGAAALFVANNSLEGVRASAAARLGGLAALAFFLAEASAALALRLPPWPWSRSLPWSASDRVRAEALFFGAVAAGIAAATYPIDARAPLAVAACAPALVLRACARARSEAGAKPGPAAWVLAEALPVAALVGMLPWAALACLALAPAAFRALVREERRRKVTAWKERHHDPAGDTFSWGGA